MPKSRLSKQAYINLRQHPTGQFAELGNIMPENAAIDGAPYAPKAKVKAPDWEQIELEYRVAILSIREIARRHHVSDRAIRKRIARENWHRDLSEKVRTQARIKLVRGSVRAEVRTGTRARASGETERACVDAAAETVVQVLRSHRHDIARGRKIVELLFMQLNEAATHRADIEAEIVEETNGDVASNRRHQMLRAVSLPAHAATMRDLAQALRNVITLERQAFSLDDRAPDEPEEAASLTQNVAQRILTNLNALAAQ